MRFDWYAATVDADPLTLAAEIGEHLGGDVFEMRGGMNGYTSGWTVERDGAVVSRILGGGANLKPSAHSSGSGTPDFVDFIRWNYPAAHHVSRLDSCEDFEERGAWDRISFQVRSIAVERNLKTIDITTTGKSGTLERTLYVGSPSSDVRIRVYEKGMQMRSLFPGKASTFSPDWVRCEVQSRPRGDARIAAASVSELGAWGFSKTSRLVAGRVLGLAAERIAGPRHDLTDFESSADHLTLQYPRTLRYLAERASDPAEFERELFRRADRVEREKRSILV
jgi:hypothetical protein